MIRYAYIHCKSAKGPGNWLTRDRPHTLYKASDDLGRPRTAEPLTPYLEKALGESLYEAIWYPAMTTTDYTTCCLLASIRDHPLQLIDAITGKNRASYCIMDHRERMIAPLGLTFNCDVTKIYAGYENMIEVFDVTQPGMSGEKFSTTPSRASAAGQKGLISALAFSPDASGMFAAGSYAESIALYDDKSNQIICFLEGSDNMEAVGAITQLLFSADGRQLISASRKDDCLRVWDIRGNVGHVLAKIPRAGDTNQRISFDINHSRGIIISGDVDGNVMASSLPEAIESKAPSASYSFQAHGDVVSSASWNEYLSLLATCSGSRGAVLNFDDDADDFHDYSLKIWQVPSLKAS